MCIIGFYYFSWFTKDEVICLSIEYFSWCGF
nr:MAG TPA: hypothetical protein [Caudoviricetes sp.]DAT27144.1 MAG TPA: hypothetical protein [Caudoviricetes sp.]